MKSTATVLLFTAFAALLGGGAQAQTCQGNSVDSFERFCKSGFIELETQKGRTRINQGSSFCFTPKERHRWRWFCRGFEEGSRCRSKSSRPLAVKVELVEGRVIWTCYER